jgi:tellurite resistance protein
MSVEQSGQKDELNRFKFFPIMMFAIIMGLSGLAIVYEKAHEIFETPKFIGDGLLMLDIIVFATILLVYLSKLLKYKQEVKKEFNHPVRINFFATVSISFLLLSVALHPLSKDLAYYSFIIGTVLQTYFTLRTISFWINQNLKLDHSNPAWFIPIVGNVLVPVAGVGFVDVNLLMYYFSIGMFFWVILTAILINRIIFHHQLIGKFMPTLFIFIAPPAVAFIAYLKMNGMHYDMFASALYNLALFFTFLLLFMYKNFLNLKFFISWWAFTFPLTAVTIASMLAYKLTHIALYSYFAYFFMLVSTLVIIFVTIKTIQHMFKGEICVEE